VDLVPDTAQAQLENETLTITIQREPRVAVEPVTVPVEGAKQRKSA
jgi:HSP20 family molecular chaperone IbpA